MQLRTKVHNVLLTIKKKSAPCFASLQTVTEREREREMAAEQTSKTIEAYPMKGGDGVHSYANNSSYQVSLSIYTYTKNFRPLASL